jgi:hypothetical protein
MRKRTFWVTAVGLAAILVAGGLFASNMGFKLNYPLDANPTNGSKDGSNTLGLPFNQQTNLIDAEQLIIDIDNGEAVPIVNQVCEWTKVNNGWDPCYTGISGTNFSLTPGYGYLVQVTANGNYIVVGSHDPLKGIPLDANPTNGSKDGSNAYAVPYHTTLTDSEGMIIEIDGQAGVQVVNQICTWTKVNNGWDPCYTGISGTNFSLTPGQAYLVQVTANHSYTPSHY